MLDDMEIETGIDLDALVAVRAPRAGHRRPRAPERVAPRRAAHAAVRVVSDADEVREHADRALQGNLAKEGEKLARQNKLFVRDRLALLLDADSFVEDALLANALAGDLPADGVVTGVGRVDGRPVCVLANDPTVKAGSWGARTVEKMVRLTEYALAARAARRLPRRFRRRAHHRPGRALPRAARRGPHLREPGSPVGQGAAGVLPVRSVGRGRCVHSCVLRRRVHGRGQRVDVPRFAAHGRGRDRRARDARRDGRRAHARDGQRLRRQPLHLRRGRDRVRLVVSFRTCRRTGTLPAPVAEAAAPVADARPIADIVPLEERRAYDMHKVIDALVDDGFVLRAEAACGRGS